MKMLFKRMHERHLITINKLQTTYSSVEQKAKVSMNVFNLDLTVYFRKNIPDMFCV